MATGKKRPSVYKVGGPDLLSQRGIRGMAKVEDAQYRVSDSVFEQYANDFPEVRGTPLIKNSKGEVWPQPKEKKDEKQAGDN